MELFLSLLSRRRDSNTRPLRPERSALPTALLLELIQKTTLVLPKTAMSFSKKRAKVRLFFDIRKFFLIILHFFF